MHVHVARPGRTCTLLLASLSGADCRQSEQARCWLLRLMYRPVWCKHLECAKSVYFRLVGTDIRKQTHKKANSFGGSVSMQFAIGCDLAACLCGCGGVLWAVGEYRRLCLTRLVIGDKTFHYCQYCSLDLSKRVMRYAYYARGLLYCYTCEIDSIGCRAWCLSSTIFSHVQVDCVVDWLQCSDLGIVK